MPQSKFFFTASDQTSKAFNNIKKSLKQISLQAVALTTAIRTLGAAIKAAASAVTKILGAALNGIVSLVKGALSTIKKLVTSLFKFIKSALTTLLSWMKKALGTLFSWVESAIKGILNGMVKLSQSAVNSAKKVIDTIVSSVKSYAAKEYNAIQLRVSLGDSYSSVMKSFKELLRFTTADKNDLLSIFATYAELGKKPEEIEKYAKATVYLSNATGRSLSQIQRLLLGQEAAGKDLEKVLHRIGITVKDQVDSYSNVEKIIAQLDKEMNEIAGFGEGPIALEQLFANIKNDITSIKEDLGKIFSPIIRYVLVKLDGLLTKINLDKISEKLGPLFENLKGIIDNIFIFFEKFLRDPSGFFKAIWNDIQQIFSNIWKNLDEYVAIIGYILGQAILAIMETIKTIDWNGVKEVFDNLAGALKSFTASVGISLNWWTQEELDEAEGSIAKVLMNAWNRAHPDFELKAGDKWYKNLWTLVRAAWYLAIKPLTTWLWEKIQPVLSDAWKWLNDTWTTYIFPTLVTAFQYLGKVLGVAINNALVSSETIRTVLNILPGVNFASQSEADEIQKALYEKVKDYLPAGWTASDLTKENLMNTQYSKNQNWMYHLYQYAPEEISWLRKYTVLQEQSLPTFEDFVNAVKDAVAPVNDLSEAAGKIVDATKAFREIDSTAGVFHYKGAGFSVSGGNGLGGGGGIQDLYSNEFRFKPYAKGGLVTKPTLALIGEAGPEFIVPLKNLPKLSGGSDPANGVPAFDWSNPFSSAKAILGIQKDLRVITQDTSFIFKWYQDTPTLEEAVENAVEEADEKKTIPWYKKIWNATKAIGKGFASYIGGTAKVLAMNGAFGSHIGNIAAGIQAQQENGTLTIWTALGEIIKEFLPYLQKGLEIVGHIFDEAFDILGNAVQILGEEIGNTLLPLLESFIPFFKVIADIVVSLAPVVSSVIAPAIKIIAAILDILTGVLDKLMPVFASLASVIQWVSDAISYAIGSVINWLASFVPWIHSTSVSKPKSIGEYYDSIMGTYSAARSNQVGVATTASASVASQTASYSGSNHIYITNDFSGSYIVGNSGFRDLAIIIKNTLEDMEYSGQSI